MSSFTPVSGLIGGALIGGASVLLFARLGRLAGISSVAHGALQSLQAREPLVSGAWRWAFLVGLIFGASACLWSAGHTGLSRAPLSPVLLLIGGGLVGWGTAQGNGCTSGHGVCGLARLSLRSLAATLTFMAAGGAVVFVVRHVGPGL